MQANDSLNQEYTPLSSDTPLLSYSLVYRKTRASSSTQNPRLNTTHWLIIWHYKNTYKTMLCLQVNMHRWTRYVRTELWFKCWFCSLFCSVPKLDIIVKLWSHAPLYVSWSYVTWVAQETHDGKVATCFWDHHKQLCQDSFVVGNIYSTHVVSSRVLLYIIHVTKFRSKVIIGSVVKKYVYHLSSLMFTPALYGIFVGVVWR